MKKLLLLFVPVLSIFLFTNCAKEEVQTTTVIIGNENGDGIYRSTNFTTPFTPSNRGLEGNAKFIQCFLDKGSVIIIGTKGGLYKSTDNGFSWKELNTGLSGNSSSVTALIEKGDKILAGTTGGGVFVSENNGVSWNAMNGGLSDKGLIVRGFLKLNNAVFAATFNGMYRLTGDSTIWKEVNNGLTDEFDRKVVAVTQKGNEIIIGTLGAGVKRSKDNGANWLDINSGLPVKNINSVFSNDSTIFVGTTNGIYKYIHKEWTDLSKTIDPSFKNIKSVAYKNGVFVIGSSAGGVLHSADNGESWTGITGNPSTASVSGILIR